jgi:hypothetical protein
MPKEDDYPPYAPDPMEQVRASARRLQAAYPSAKAAIESGMARHRRQDRMVIVIAGIVAGVVAGALLVVYGIL